jgi:hypothetical protein
MRKLKIEKRKHLTGSMTLSPNCYSIPLGMVKVREFSNKKNILLGML